VIALVRTGLKTYNFRRAALSLVDTEVVSWFLASCTKGCTKVSTAVQHRQSPYTSSCSCLCE